MGEYEGVIKVVLLIGGIPGLIILATGISSAIQYMVSGRTPADSDDIASLKERLDSAERRLETAEERTRLAMEHAEYAQSRLRIIEAALEDDMPLSLDTPN